MAYKHGMIANLPADPREIFDFARTLAFHTRVDEKGTQKNPGIWMKQLSDLSYEEAFEIIQENHPSWSIHFRNISELVKGEEDYWDFGGCNLSSNSYGEVFLWIYLRVEDAEEVFRRFNLEKKYY